MADKTLGAGQIRRRFVDFFASRGHEHVSSSPLVPENDPTLLFVNAGMNQFKDVFTGRETRPYKRAVTVQKCLRAGGKHNDLENVGFTPRHQTMFEMLGNFSFGDYFKKDAIAWGWEFLTGELGLPKERLVVTVFDGTGENAPADDEASELWTAHIDPGRIYRCSAKENFWQMGDVGPCGPCSEIHIFNGEVAPATADQPGTGPEFDEDNYLELWNLVFMQYEKVAGGEMKNLPRPSIDTGSGLERVAATVGGFDSNYGTDLLSPMVERARTLAGSGMPSGAGEAPLRVIADHARATAFLIADGVFPDRVGRSYVLRRIMRRAIRHGTEIGLSEPFFHDVCRQVVESFGEVYPELSARAATIDEVVRGEEEAFRRTLDRGLRRLRSAIDSFDRKGSGGFPPDVAAELYDTYGFPLDLTGVILEEHGLSLDEAAAEAALKEKQGATGGRGAQLGNDSAVSDLYFRVQAEVGDTEFTGYAHDAGEGTVAALLVDGATVDAATPGTQVEVVVDRSPMYAESGGQVGDAGTITGTGGLRIEIVDTVKPVGSMHVHRGRVEAGSVRQGQTVTLTVDATRRSAIRRNHSATHLLHLALRETLGEHVVQKGSLVDAERLRFDFSHPRQVTAEQRVALEIRVNEMVLANAETATKLASLEGWSSSIMLRGVPMIWHAMLLVSTGGYCLVALPSCSYLRCRASRGYDSC
ncbi:MAG: alanine--tRNA ligase [Myxococcota bacterium]